MSDFEKNDVIVAHTHTRVCTSSVKSGRSALSLSLVFAILIFGAMGGHDLEDEMS